MATKYNPKKWTAEEIQVLKDQHGKKTIVQIHQEFLSHRTYLSVISKTIKLKLFRSKTDIPLPSKNSFNTSYWKIPTLINSYLGGFLAADGCISDMKHTKKLQLKLAIKDESVIDLFIKELEFLGPKYYSKNCCLLSENSTWTENVAFYVNCFHENAKYLEDFFGIVPNKTKRLAPSNLVNYYLNWAFIIGLIDGDGCISFDLSKNKEKIVPALHYTSSSLEIVNWLKDWLDRFYPAPYLNSKNICHYEKHSVITVRGLRAAVIIDYLRQFPIPKLARKWDQPEILEFIETSKHEHPEAFKTLNITEMNESIQRDYPQPTIIDNNNNKIYAPQT